MVGSGVETLRPCSPMNSPSPKLIFLPGMDGTGELFKELLEALPKAFGTELVRYPTDRCLSYAQLMPIVKSSIPDHEPFVLVVESFSTPLAVQLAATNPSNLKGLVICAGFVTSPAPGLWGFICKLFAPILCGVTLPKWTARLLLVGPNPSPRLVAAVRATVSSVKSKVLSARLRAVLSCDARTELHQVVVPILYIRAKEDLLIPESCFEEIRRIKPQTAVKVIRGPHLLFQREPQQTAEIISGFIQQ